ncbi:MAG: hypothetical protein ACYCSF_12060 [Acidimicrobiales bacterium]
MSSTASGERLLLDALGLPRALEDRPFAQTVATLGNKTGTFSGCPMSEKAKVSHELPGSAHEDLDRPDTVPAGYGLGGARSATVGMARSGPVGDVIEESFRGLARGRLRRLAKGGSDA